MKGQTRESKDYERQLGWFVCLCLISTPAHQNLVHQSYLSVHCQAMASRAVEIALENLLRENEELRRELLIKQSRLHRLENRSKRIRRPRHRRRHRSNRRHARRSLFDRHAWLPARDSRRSPTSQKSSHANSWRGSIARVEPLQRDACQGRSTTRDPVDFVRDFITETEVDVKAENLFLQLNWLDMFMVARRGRVTGRNRAAVLISRVEEVEKYHKHCETLPARKRRDYRRYCAEFYQFEVERPDPELM